MATPFENFINRELPRRSAFITKAIAGDWDDDPNLPGAPAILQSAPLGTWFYEETKRVAWRRGLSYWERTNPNSIMLDDVTIYVDPAGDDNAPGTEAEPIKTLLEATNRIPLLGSGVTLQLSAGQHVLLDFADLPYTKQLIFTSLGRLVLQGTLSVSTNFVVGSVTDNTITAQGAPGWVVNEHKGRLLEWKPYPAYPDYIVQFFILSNNANSITVALTPASLGGSTPYPDPSDSLDIKQLDSVIVPPATHSGYWVNRLFFSGCMGFRFLIFDGSAGGYAGPAAHFSTKMDIYQCKIINWTQGIDMGDGNNSIGACWFENCSEYAMAISKVVGSISKSNFAGGNVFKNCGTSVAVGEGGLLTTCSNTSIWAYDTTRVFDLASNSYISDYAVRVCMQNVSDYVRLNKMAKYARINTPLKIWPGMENPTTVVKILNGNAQVVLKDSSNATMQGTTAYVDMDGYLIDHATYILDKAFFDTKGNVVADLD